ncbi:MAG: hypothetical protein ACK5U8_03010, partial [Deltaproteobacteria bacterium]
MHLRELPALAQDAVGVGREDLGADAWLDKPFSSELLVRSIEDLVVRRRTEGGGGAGGSGCGDGACLSRGIAS